MAADKPDRTKGNLAGALGSPGLGDGWCCLLRAPWAVRAGDGPDHDLPFQQNGFEPDQHAWVVQRDVGVGAVIVDQDADLAGVSHRARAMPALYADR